MIFLVILIHIQLFTEAIIYALILNQPRIYGWYHKDHVWITVVGGVGLVGKCLGELVYLGLFPLVVLYYYVSLFIVSAIPIIYWQRQRAKQRKRDEEAVDRRP